MFILVFSCNRAMQLNAALSSFLIHCQDANQAQLVVIFRATNAFHAQQYDRLAEEFADYSFINFLKENNFRNDVLRSLIDNFRIKYGSYISKLFLKLWSFSGTLSNPLLKSKNTNNILFLVDDNIFVRDFSLHEIVEALKAYPSAIGFSLRLGKNTSYCYPLDKVQSIPHFSQISNDMLMFNWTLSDCDFGYPLELSSSVYRINELLPLLNRLPFMNPNTMEGAMAKHALDFKLKKPCLLCYSQSVTFCDPLNRVQDIALNRAGSTSKYSIEALAQLYEKGYRIKVEAYNDFIPTACHQEVDLIIEKNL
jgi:hypothetical protein